MLRAGTGLSSHPDPREATRRACRRALAGLGVPGGGPRGAAGAPSGALLFASGDHAEAAPELLAAASEALGTEAIAGASVSGLWASPGGVRGGEGAEAGWGVERGTGAAGVAGRGGRAGRKAGPDEEPARDAGCGEGLRWDAGRGAEPAGAAGMGEGRAGGFGVAVAVLAGASVHPFLLRDLAGAEERAGAELAGWMAARGGPPGARDLVLLLPDANGLALGPLAAGLHGPLGAAAALGLGAAEGPGGAALGWRGREVATGAVAGLVVRGIPAPRLAVAPAFRPATDRLAVTRARGHWILGLDGRPALDLYREVAGERLARDLPRAAEHVLVALPRGSGAGEGGGLVPCRVAGFDPRRRAFAVPFRARAAGAGGGRAADELVLVVRDPAWALGELKERLERLAAGLPAVPRDAAAAAPAPPGAYAPSAASTLPGSSALPGASAPPGASARSGALGLWLSCPRRGELLRGSLGLEGFEDLVGDLEAAYVQSVLEGVPLLCVSGPAQIGPVAGRPEVLVHSGVGALLGAGPAAGGASCA